MPDQVLSGLKVIDLTHFVAGPYCAKLLADYGADVIKVERPGMGDGSRQVGPFPGDVPHVEKSGLFLYLNTNKKGVTLNLKTRTGAQIFRDLLMESDVLIENFSPRVMPGLGLDYGALRKINPKLVMTSISSFGQTGPYRDWKASEIVLYALSGQMSRQGDPDREPLKHALNVFQYFAGEIASTVTLAAAIRSAISGDGEHIDVSILETMQGDIENKVVDYAYSGHISGRTTAKNYTMFPFGGFAAKDGYVVFQHRGGGERWVPRLFELLGQPDLMNNPKFSTPQSRRQNLDEFNAMFYAWTSDHTKKEIFEAATRARYPQAPVNTVDEVVEDPHIKARGFFVDIEHPVAGKLCYPGAPFRLPEAGYKVRQAAPLLGQHNEEIYCGLLGYSRRDLSILRSRGVI